ncbi:MAG: PrsW family intramembrane metalloprotease [Ekhidna sp.]|nr:PrsW family intramembrane metalloprotease [Ekhidna sp.]
MTGLITIIFWILAIPGFYIGIKYSQSRNKKLFFKSGAYKAFVVSLLIVLGGGLMYFILPQEPIELAFLKLHSETVTDEVSRSTGAFKYLLKSLEVFTEMNVIGFLSAIMVTGIWFFYVRNLDFFNKEKLKFTVFGFGLGVLATFFAFPLSDFVTDIFSIEYSSSTFYNLFVYSFLGIGIVEELIKIVPVLIILVLTSQH